MTFFHRATPPPWSGMTLSGGRRNDARYLMIRPGSDKGKNRNYNKENCQSGGYTLFVLRRQRHVRPANPSSEGAGR